MNWKNGHPKGMSGKVHSEETKQKIKLTCSKIEKTDEWNKKNSDAHKGKIFTKEHCENLSLAQKNNPQLKDEKTGKFISR